MTSTDTQILLEMIRRIFAEKRQTNPRYSLRSLARRAGMSPAAVSEILNGKRRLTRRSTERIKTAFVLPPELEDRLEHQAAKAFPPKKT